MDMCNPITKRWIDAYIVRPQATLLINCNNDSEAGIEIAEYICSKLNSTKAPLYKLTKDEGKSLGISEIRELQKYLSLRADNVAEYSRFVLISNAEDLTTEAQNSLLKLIEELPSKTILVLVATDTKHLLQTIRSRCFHINVLPVSYKQAFEYGDALHVDEPRIKQAFFISEGSVSTYRKLINNKGDTLEEVIGAAKQFIQSSVVERQEMLLKMQKDDVDLAEFLQSLKLTAKSGMRNAKNLDAKKRWKDILVETINTENQLESNVQTKLAMLALSVSI